MEVARVRCKLNIAKTLRTPKIFTKARESPKENLWKKLIFFFFCFLRVENYIILYVYVPNELPFCSRDRDYVLLWSVFIILYIEVKKRGERKKEKWATEKESDEAQSFKGPRVGFTFAVWWRIVELFHS